MKQLAVFINIAGPIENPEHGLIHQIELGIVERGNDKPEAVRILAVTSDMGKAIDEACHALKGYIQEHYSRFEKAADDSNKPPQTFS